MRPKLVPHAVLVSAAFAEVPPPLGDQLVPGGRLVQPIGPGGDEEVTPFVKQEGRPRRSRTVTCARFVPLVGLHGRRSQRP